MTKPTVDQLLAAERRLNLSLVAAVVTLVASLGWAYLDARSPATAGQTAGIGAVVALAALVAAYAWFAASAGGAARLLGEPGWGYVAWIVAAPFLAAIPIPIPFLSTAIAVSPLSIKFLLGGQLQSAMRKATFED